MWIGRILFSLFFICFFSSFSRAGHRRLLPGQTAEAWKLKDLNGRERSMDAWKGKVLLINYLDPDESNLNENVIKALQAAVRRGILSVEKCSGLGIIDCASSWKPDSLIRCFAAKKAQKLKQSNTELLMDYGAKVRDLWGFDKDSSNIVILDKNRVCRAVIRGKVPENKIQDIVKLMCMLQKE